MIQLDISRSGLRRPPLFEEQGRVVIFFLTNKIHGAFYERRGDFGKVASSFRWSTWKVSNVCVSVHPFHPQVNVQGCDEEVKKGAYSGHCLGAGVTRDHTTPSGSVVAEKVYFPAAQIFAHGYEAAKSS